MPQIVHLSCKCLNVIVHIDGLQPLERSAVELDENLSQDEFFNQEFGQVQRVVKVIRALPNLVQVRRVGNAHIDQCLNCNMNTHALLHRHDQDDVFFVNANLLQSSAIEDLKKHANFSKTYQVVVFHMHDDKEVRFDYLPADTEKSIRALKQKADDCINSESHLTEERIRIFTETEFNLFNDYKDRVHAENKALARIIIKHQQFKGSNSNSLENLRAHSLRKVPDAFEPIAKTPSPQVILDDSPSCSPRTRASLRKSDSLDAECLFQLDGMDDVQSFELSESSDTEDCAVPIRQATRSHQSVCIAKSLPMNIPVYMSSALQAHHGDETDEESENTRDIAASMQALARSVNGDAVFGDLPRTRCRTFI